MQNDRETAVKKLSRKESVISFPEYLRKIKEKFGDNSKQYLLAKMYETACVRDDYGGMVIVESLTEANDNEINYLVINSSNDAYFIFHQFKTSRKYGTVEVELPDELIILLKNFIAKNKLTNLLFKPNGLSEYVSSMNKKVGVMGGGSRALRHIMISTILANENVSDLERIELSTIMGHSPNVQYAYQRILEERESQRQESQIPENVAYIPEDLEEEEDDDNDVGNELITLIELEELQRRAQKEKDDANEALENENNIRREQERLLRVERERSHSDEPEPKKQKRTRGKGIKRKETTDDELPSRKIVRKITL